MCNECLFLLSHTTNASANRARLISQKPIIHHASSSAFSTHLATQTRVSWLNHNWRGSSRGTVNGGGLWDRRRREGEERERCVLVLGAWNVDHLLIGSGKHSPTVLARLSILLFNAGVVTFRAMVASGVMQQGVVRCWASLRTVSVAHLSRRTIGGMWRSSMGSRGM